MKYLLIVGLGNYPTQYTKTRHNIGFMVIDKLCAGLNLSLSNEKFNGRYVKVQVEDKMFIIAEPLTYMNLSGDFVANICNFYKISHRDIMIVADDADNKVGTLRVRDSGSSGGQNGIKDIINKLGTDQITRIKLGISRPADKRIDLANHVLSEFNKDEKIIIAKTIDKAVEALMDYMNGSSLSVLMNKYNTSIK
ncbi:MAG: aminoacyl-tRNA hydrolase [Mycoplasmataceae bacterium]|jgi:PTH1 family peptidyl-tRNA hydrolase|nr:aminoacyl-tRNA hydrolase [Mycoplasmataceae bacterium]